MSNTTNSQSSWAPVAVFAYNRPDKLSALMSNLQACNGFAASQVKIFVDGAKGDADQLAVEAVREYVRSLALPNVSYSFNKVNRGLRNSIFAGVTEAVGEHGKVIVLEDDLVLSPVALEYFNKGLLRYETEQRVWSIAGYLYDAPQLRQSGAAVSLPFTHPWGWATWKRAWDQFELDNRPDSKELRSRGFKSAFDMNGVYPFTKQLKNSLAHRVNSWSVHWYYTVFRHGGVSIFPPRRIVDNVGLNAGTHGGVSNPYNLLASKPPLLDRVPEFGDPEHVDYVALDALRRCRELRIRRSIAHLGTAKRALVERGKR